MAECAYLDGTKCLRGMTGVCCDCPARLELGRPDFAEKWVDPLVVVGRQRQPASEALRGMLAGRPAFLMCGGPSANKLPLELLGRRGCWTLAVNNAAGHPRVRPQAFVCSDPPQKFSHSVWLDPQVMKFVPTPKMSGYRANLREKRDGQFHRSAWKVPDCPNVWGFQRHSWLRPDWRFFAADGACWGNNDRGVKETGEEKSVCTTLLGLRLLYFLGCRRIYLVGVDFVMTPDAGYSFGQARDPGACDSNNHLFRVVGDWLCRMRECGTFAAFGVEIYNCNPTSGLRAFAHVPFGDAVADARGPCEDVPDLGGWYDK